MDQINHEDATNATVPETAGAGAGASSDSPNPVSSKCVEDLREEAKIPSSGKLPFGDPESGSCSDEDEGDNKEMTMKDNSTKDEVERMTHQETQKIWIGKSVVLVLLVVTATLVSAGAYIFLSREEDGNYKANYNQVVSTIRQASTFHASNIFVTLRSFSHTITGLAEAQKEQFPFVHIPAFEHLGAGVRSATGAEMIAWAVRVEEDQIEEWKNYTLTTYQKNLDQSRATALSLQAEGSSVKPSDFVDGNIAPYPFLPNFKEGGIILAPNYGPGPYWPAWMVSPPIFNPSFINTDPSPGALKAPIAAVNVARRPILTDTVPVENLANRAINAKDHEAYHASLVDFVHDEEQTAFTHPHSALMVPVFEKLNNPLSRIVGTFAVIIPWDRYLINLLPEGVSGITCVLRNSCGKAWTYDLEGTSAFYRGEGDFHETDYVNTEVIIPFQEEGSTTAGTVEGECQYSYYIYATKEFEESFRSNLPWALTLVVATTFAVMVATFVAYNLLVHKRNRIVVGHATKTNAIVSSLFPKDVKDRLLEEEEGKQQQRNQPRSDPLSFLLNEERRKNRSPPTAMNDSARTIISSDPIANLYEECTVYFADLTGFTKWSSTRQPVDVFKLLEGIYSEFDKLAKKRGVFKVETIGDCYVAITGVPEPRKDHCVAMAKFAWDTRDRMRTVTKALEETLGPDTGELELRVGLHSGAVTAGVLRGEKSRFQLFGSTVNQASRMESTGEKGKIQVSPETAHLLREAGKGSWLTPRQELVEAKGLGMIQTYFLEIDGRAATATNVSSINDSDLSCLIDVVKDALLEAPEDITGSIALEN